MRADRASLLYGEGSRRSGPGGGRNPLARPFLFGGESGLLEPIFSPSRHDRHTDIRPTCPAGFDLTPPSGGSARGAGGRSDRRGEARPAAPRHRGAVLRRAAGREAGRGLLLPRMRPAAVQGRDQVRERHRLAQLHPAGLRRPRHGHRRTAPTAWCGPRRPAPAAAATRATSSPTARRRPACATASTRWRCSSWRRARPLPDPLGRGDGVA